MSFGADALVPASTSATGAIPMLIAALSAAVASAVPSCNCTAGALRGPTLPTHPRSIRTSRPNSAVWRALARATSETGRSGTIRVTPTAQRYWPVLLTVSMARPASLPLPEMRVRM
jgi:hypothetical protein